MGYQAASAKKLATAYLYRDYVEKIDTEIENTISWIRSLGTAKKAAEKELKALEEYYRLTQARFDNQIASADELSRSIASLSKARAKLKAIESMRFMQKCRLLLQISLGKFEEKVFR